ncbi:hypothetical protein M9458_034234, partial [Cirrhinus mrigala]
MWFTLLFCLCYTVCLDTNPACLTTICKIKLTFGFYTLPTSPRYRKLRLPKIQRLSEDTDRTMDPASHLFCLRQGNQCIEDYVVDFCELCYLVDFNDVALKDIFRNGLNNPIRSGLPGGKIHWSLEQYIDFALWLAGSPFTVGVADETPCCPQVSAKPVNFSVMSGIIQVTSEPHHAMPTKPKSAQVTSTKPRSANVTSAKPQPVHVTSAKPQPVLVTSAKLQPAHAVPAAPGPAHAVPAAPGPALAMLVHPESAPVMAALLQPAHKMTAISKPVHKMAATPEPVHKMAATPEPVHKMAAIPKPVHKMAAIPKPVHKMAVIPKPVHKMAAPSESPAKMAATPEPHQVKIISSKSHLA